MESLLEETKKSFDHWRVKAGNKRYNNPALKAKAVDLLKDHSFTVVSRALGITTNTLRVWKKSIEKNNPHIVPETGFMKISLTPKTASFLDGDIPKTHTPIEVTLPNGLCIAIKEASLSSAMDWIRALSQEVVTCSI